MKAALVLALVVLAGSVVTLGGNEVGLLVSPRVSPAPATFRINVIVEPDAKNRTLVLEADSGDYYTSSSVQLEGSDAGRLHPFTLVELPPGNYEVLATVLRSDGQQRQAVVDCIVTP